MTKKKNITKIIFENMPGAFAAGVGIFLGVTSILRWRSAKMGTTGWILSGNGVSPVTKTYPYNTYANSEFPIHITTSQASEVIGNLVIGETFTAIGVKSIPTSKGVEVWIKIQFDKLP